MKISDELLGFVSFRKGLLPLGDLVGNRKPPGVSTGPGPFRVTVDAAAGGDLAVSVRTGEPGIDGYLLDPAAEDASQIGVIVIISFG